MIFIQDFARRDDIQIIRRGFMPRQRRDPVEIGGGNRVFRRRRMHARKPLQFAQRLFFGFLRQIFLFNFFAVLVRLHRIFVAFPQLLADGLELLAQIIFPLVFVDVVLDLRLNLIAQLQHFHLVIHHFGKFFQAQLDVGRVQHFLFLLHRRINNRRNQIGQRSRFADGLGHRAELRRQKRRKLQNPVKQRQQVRHQRFGFEILHFLFIDQPDARLLIRLPLYDFFHGETAEPL